MPEGDPWERVAVTPRLHMYGSGARLDFPKYLEGPSQVPVASVEEIQAWLLECQCESDAVLFAESDFWQHPVTFERLRAGDCEDFALWAWRKLIELGVDADIIAGYCLKGGELDGRHAWILFREGGTEYLFEPTCRTKDGMIRPLADVRDAYLPEFGADRTGRRFGFTGYAIGQKRLLRSKSARRIA
jgi:hypothetical protein